VVIAIISVLAALLLPVLHSAMEEARRTACRSNLRQIYLGSIAYGDDFGRSLPANVSSSVSTGNARSRDDICSKYYLGNAANGPTGWFPFAKNRYMAYGILLCPSMDRKLAQTDFESKLLGITSNFGGMVDYGYRYNIDRVAHDSYGRVQKWDLQRGVLEKPEYGLVGLFADSGGTKINTDAMPFAATAPTWYTSDGQPGGLTAGASSTGVRWAHQAGGNVMAHNGEARWIPNVINYSSTYYGWPNRSGIYSTWNRGSAGIDYWFAYLRR